MLQFGGKSAQRGDHDWHDWSLESLHKALMEFPALAVAQPSPIFAVLSTYDSIPTVDGPASSSVPLTSYSQVFLHLNTLLDAYMEFRDIKQALSAQIWGTRAGTITFDPTFVRESENEHHFEATSSGLARAKHKCMSKMVDITRAVESMSMSSTQTVKEGFAETFYEEAIEFRERLPRMLSITSSKNSIQNNAHEQLFVGSVSSLLPMEKQKVRDLVAEHPNIGAHIRISPPCGEGSSGSTFCSLDFLKPDWIVAKVVVQVSCGAIATITIHYANGLSTVFGPRRQGGKLFELELDIAKKEKIVSCSFEMGRVVGMGNSPLRMTALRLSTNRCSVLIAQAGNWKQPLNGLSKRASVSFKDLQMVDYDQPMSNGHIVGFWGQTDPVAGFGLCRLAPIWCDMYARPTEPTTFEPITEDQPEGVCFPCGVWDTYRFHDENNPMQRTQDVVTYTSEFSEQTLPNISLGMKKMDTFSGANMRFNAATESVTASSFAIGVEQWSNSILYGSVSNVSFSKRLRLTDTLEPNSPGLVFLQAFMVCKLATSCATVLRPSDRSASQGLSALLHGSSCGFLGWTLGSKTVRRFPLWLRVFPTIPSHWASVASAPASSMPWSHG